MKLEDITIGQTVWTGNGWRWSVCCLNDDFESSVAIFRASGTKTDVLHWVRPATLYASKPTAPQYDPDPVEPEEEAPAPAPARCPSCGSHKPNLVGGETKWCTDPWHGDALSPFKGKERDSANAANQQRVDGLLDHIEQLKNDLSGSDAREEQLKAELAAVKAELEGAKAIVDEQGKTIICCRGSVYNDCDPVPEIQSHADSAVNRIRRLREDRNNKGRRIDELEVKLDTAEKAAEAARLVWRCWKEQTKAGAILDALFGGKP